MQHCFVCRVGATFFLFILLQCLFDLDYQISLDLLNFQSIMSWRFIYMSILVTLIFFSVGRGLNPEPCMFYVLSLPIELSSRGQSL